VRGNGAQNPFANDGKFEGESKDSNLVFVSQEMIETPIPCPNKSETSSRLKTSGTGRHQVDKIKGKSLTIKIENGMFAELRNRM
jgi:hypothetical protein